MRHIQHIQHIQYIRHTALAALAALALLAFPGSATPARACEPTFTKDIVQTLNHILNVLEYGLRLQIAIERGTVMEDFGNQIIRDQLRNEGLNRGEISTIMALRGDILRYSTASQRRRLWNRIRRSADSTGDAWERRRDDFRGPGGARRGLAHVERNARQILNSIPHPNVCKAPFKEVVREYSHSLKDGPVTPKVIQVIQRRRSERSRQLAEQAKALSNAISARDAQRKGPRGFFTAQAQIMGQQKTDQEEQQREQQQQQQAQSQDDSQDDDAEEEEEELDESDMLLEAQNMAMILREKARMRSEIAELMSVRSELSIARAIERIPVTGRILDIPATGGSTP